MWVKRRREMLPFSFMKMKGRGVLWVTGGPPHPRVYTQGQVASASAGAGCAGHTSPCPRGPVHWGRGRAGLAGWPPASGSPRSGLAPRPPGSLVCARASQRLGTLRAAATHPTLGPSPPAAPRSGSALSTSIVPLSVRLAGSVGGRGQWPPPPTVLSCVYSLSLLF